MKKLLSQLFFLTTLVVIISSCRKDKPVDSNNGQPNEVAIGTLSLGSTISADFQGRVVDESGNAIPNVLITAGTKTAYTDAQGMFVIKNTNVKEKLAYVKAEKSGYFPGSRSLIPTQTSSNYIKIQMMTLNVAGTITAGVPATVTTNGGASIDFKGQYVDQNGNPYSGSVTVAAKYLPALAPETSEQMPGMLYAENTDGEAGALVSYGMIVVELYGNSGQSLNIAQGSSATLHMPVDDQQAGSAPATIPLWFFDEVAGYWIEEGSANLVNGEYVGEVAHFTFWNCDVFYDDCQLNGLVTDNLGNPLGSATVEINLGYTSTTGFTNSDGTFFTYVPAGQNIDINVSYGCGGVVTPYAVGPYASNSVNNETFISQLGTSILNLTGTLVNCDLQPVTNADVYFYDGLNYLTYHVDNGIIDINVPYCSGATTADIYIYDYNQPYSSFSNTNIAITYPLMDLAQVVICDTVSTGGWIGAGGFCDSGEFIDIWIDGNVVFSDSCVQFQYYDSPSTGFIIYPSDSNYAIYSIDVNGTGNYPGTTVFPGSSGEVIFANSYDMNFSIPGNFTTDISIYEGAGGQMILDLSGTYTDLIGGLHSVMVVAGVYIPN